MSLRIGDTAPNFTAETTEGTIDFHQWIGDHWAVLYSHPADFTPVCTTELGRTANLKPEFDKRNTKVIAVSVDSVADHRRWIDDINDTQQTTVNFPIIGDQDRKVAELYEMIHPKASDTVPVRSVFFIDPNKKIRAMITYPPATGRNFQEILRVIDALQLTDNHKVATPVDWKDGDDCVILPSISDEQAKAQFPKGWKTLRAYLRLTPQPNK
ncbi:peroxiredoxin [Nitrococcus mobilis]|uniref:Peroxidase n=1 Tax=Nitrococcus mobilis Nb-231 TaxID=314278 RepID=A4BQQ9_9GAMM|nr:peroxiredoxin [Nitrococcus mobilis]EAR21909.1 Peroxidase [Nitrococcus mobilis Nb-231]